MNNRTDIAAAIVKGGLDGPLSKEGFDSETYFNLSGYAGDSISRASLRTGST